MPRIARTVQALASAISGLLNRPVPSWPENSPLLIVGLAPGLKGANRTGVPFVGDASGAMLTKVLNRLNALDQARITNAVKCLPRNK